MNDISSKKYALHAKIQKGTFLSIQGNLRFKCNNWSMYVMRIFVLEVPVLSDDKNKKMKIGLGIQWEFQVITLELYFYYIYAKYIHF